MHRISFAPSTDTHSPVSFNVDLQMPGNPSRRFTILFGTGVSIGGVLARSQRDWWREADKIVGQDSNRYVMVFASDNKRLTPEDGKFVTLAWRALGRAEGETVTVHDVNEPYTFYVSESSTGFLKGMRGKQELLEIEANIGRLKDRGFFREDKPFITFPAGLPTGLEVGHPSHRARR